MVFFCIYNEYLGWSCEGVYSCGVGFSNVFFGEFVVGCLS